MVTGAKAVEVVASASPVRVFRGGLGEGKTLLAAAWPVLATTMVAVKVWPRERVAGMAKEVMVRAAGVSTVAVLEASEGALMGAPLPASLPAAPAERWRVPVPEPFSVKVKVKVALPPPGMVAGETALALEAPAPPVMATE